MGVFLTAIAATVGIYYMSDLLIMMISGYHDGNEIMQVPNYFNGEFDDFNFTKKDTFLP